MANHKATQKDTRQAAKRRERNRYYGKTTRNAIRDLKAITDKSAAGVLVFSRMKKGKKAQWFINPNVPRSYNYTPDAAKAIYLLATTESSFGQVWHLPSAKPALTGKQFIMIAAKYMNGSDKIMVLPKWLLKMTGWFIPFIKEAYEMNYQDEFAFLFDSSKFETAFNFRPVTYEQGIKETADWFLKQP